MIPIRRKGVRPSVGFHYKTEQVETGTLRSKMSHQESPSVGQVFISAQPDDRLCKQLSAPFNDRWTHGLLSSILALVLLVCGVPTAAAAQELPRRPWLGLALELLAAEKAGAYPQTRVREVMSGGTGASIGVQTGDIITSVGQKRIRAPAEVAEALRDFGSGQSVKFGIERSGAKMELSGIAVPLPHETYEGAKAHYASVPFDGGWMRDIMVTPDGVSEPPVVFLIQGINCVTMEGAHPGSPYRALTQDLVRKGIAMYRVEKPGVGDSIAGREQCDQMDFSTELAAFRTAYHHLVSMLDGDASRVFMFGHSMGGIQAPFLAAEKAPGGVAVFGTVLRNWADYHALLHFFQSSLLFGLDPVEQMGRGERYRNVLNRFYFSRQKPVDIADEHPSFAADLRGALNWDGGDLVLGRHYRFTQELAQLPVANAWKHVNSRVLSIAGETDFVALLHADHQFIADLVNHYRPGSAHFTLLPNTDHAFGKTGDREAFRRTAAELKSHPSAPFNPKVAATLADWIRERH